MLPRRLGSGLEVVVGESFRAGASSLEARGRSSLVHGILDGLCPILDAGQGVSQQATISLLSYLRRVVETRL